MGFGKILIWDVTVTDTLAASYIAHSLSSAGSAAERAAELKVSKYSSLCDQYDFIPIAIETLGPINTSAIHFLSSLGKRIAARTGDAREGAFLFQRLSITIQQYNCVALSDSFVREDLTEAS